jgi:hypothetical protein
MEAIRIPISGDRLENARAEVAMLSDDALIYMLGVSIVVLNEQVDEEEVPETKQKLGYLAKCLQGPSEVIPPNLPREAVELALILVRTFLDHVPKRDQPTWTN